MLDEEAIVVECKLLNYFVDGYNQRSQKKMYPFVKKIFDLASRIYTYKSEAMVFCIRFCYKTMKNLASNTKNKKKVCDRIGLLYNFRLYY